MKSNLKKAIQIFILFFSLTPSLVHGQLVVNFFPGLYGQSLDGLIYAQILNSTGSELRIVETIKINELSGTNVANIKTAPFVLTQGSNSINRAAFANGRFNFSHSYYGNVLSQTGRLPEGEYEYCFETEIVGKKPDQVPALYENCFTLLLQPMTPLLLIDPADEDMICNKRPNLIWQLPAPLSADSRSRVILTELKEKQDIAEAIAFNVPVLNEGNVFGNMLTYPASAPELKEGRKYVWQVVVYTEKTILKKSEIWTFKVQCEEKQKIYSGNSYRELKEADDGNFYIADKVLSFSFNNPYGNQRLDYTIESLSNPHGPIKKLPKLKMNAGVNKFDLDLSDHHSFKSGEEYVLKIRLANNRELHLRFIYKNE
jgi:hypothetical protein